MQNEINKKDIRVKDTIMLPFDGTAKCGDEVAKMVVEALTTKHEEKVEFVFPGQWEMTPKHMLHPQSGVLTLLNKNVSINTFYKFAGFMRNGTIGISATRTC